MTALRIVPCLDIDGGRVVKGVRFSALRDAGDPVACARRYEDAGADELVILDVSATVEQRANARDVVAAVREVLSIPLTVGGGVRSVGDAAALLNAGADRIATNSAAVERPALLTELADAYGRQCIVLAIDAARRLDDPARWQVVIHGGRTRLERDAVDWAAHGTALGAGEILLTSWDRDGTGKGYDLDLLRAIRAATTVPLVASGGASTTDHCIDAARAGADAILAASIFHDDRIPIPDVKTALTRAGMEVRPA